MSIFVIANFGGPRSLEEISPFLTELLTDIDVLRSPFPRFVEKWFFQRLARKRSKTAIHDYQLIGGKSPIFEDTEWLAAELSRQTGKLVIPFHRYITATHSTFIHQMICTPSHEVIVLPLYPQFSYATTGSVARFFQDHLPQEIVDKIKWIKSYSLHEGYIVAMQRCIGDFLQQQKLDLKDVVLFFSAHGLPQMFVNEGDPYARECSLSFEAIKRSFAEAHSLLAFQSQFGPGEWLRPYTRDLCLSPHTWNLGRQTVVFVPLSFTSDHIETLFEIEHQYLPMIRKHGLRSYRCPALNRRPDWINSCIDLLNSPAHFSNGALVRN